eukprot:CAMPEP_0175800198 /NCGR_PEP_ID=MMETSP0097-20121207/86890_1 /TAXON_ID=311494 /ORGANISM="Alexandrium monilatum, Strain CCMP3105" /LENGTH=287 /DNA_ID=CAMNT_0017111473 /DNA_START=60 /DNA_END=920 /DNA_ORIENTATION=-
MTCDRLYEFVNAVCKLPWPVIGFADGCLSTLGTSLLEAADHVLASQNTQFKLAHVDAPVSVEEFFQSEGPSATVVEDGEVLMSAHRYHCKKGIAIQSGPTRELLTMARAHGRVQKDLLQCTCKRPREDHPEMQTPPAVVGEEALGNPAPHEPETTPEVEAAAQPLQSDPAACQLVCARTPQENLPPPSTTLVIYDLPVGISTEEVATTINFLGYRDRYNLLYVEDVRSGVQMRSSFALINFLTAGEAEAFAATFHCYSSYGAGRMACGNLQLSNVQGMRSVIDCWVR